MIFKLLRLFVKTLNADDKYYLCNIWDLKKQYQMQLSKIFKIFCPFFSSFLKSTSNFNYFEKKDDSDTLCISEITDCERHG